MALEEKRELDEILIRCNSKTNGGVDGVAILYRSWVERDGVEINGTSSMENPTDAELSSPEVAERIGQLPGVLKAQLEEAADALESAQQDLFTAQAEIARLNDQIAASQAEVIEHD